MDWYAKSGNLLCHDASGRERNHGGLEPSGIKGGQQPVQVHLGTTNIETGNDVKHSRGAVEARRGRGPGHRTS